MTAQTKYGLLAGFNAINCITIGYVLGFFNAKVQYSPYVMLAIAIVGVGLIFFAIRERKFKEMGGYLDWKDGMRTGLGVAFWCGLIMVIFMFIFTKWINPAWVTAGFDYQKTVLLAKGKNAAEVEKIIYEAKQNFSLIRTLFSIFSNILLVGGFFSFLISWFSKKDKPLTEMYVDTEIDKISK
jgi:hypothetical protein